MAHCLNVLVTRVAHTCCRLELLPEEARMPMMKIALIYQQELDEDKIKQ